MEIWESTDSVRGWELGDFYTRLAFCLYLAAPFLMKWKSSKWLAW